MPEFFSYEQKQEEKVSNKAYVGQKPGNPGALSMCLSHVTQFQIWSSLWGPTQHLILRRKSLTGACVLPCNVGGGDRKNLELLAHQAHVEQQRDNSSKEVMPNTTIAGALESSQQGLIFIQE